MPNESPKLSKTCSQCGLVKPIFAFVQLSGSRGTVYSNICASCRKTSINQTITEKDEGTSTPSGKTLDSKAKIQIEIDKKLEREHTESLSLSEEGKKELRKNAKNLKSQSLLKHERAHREKQAQQNTQKKERKNKTKAIWGSEEQLEEERKFDSNAPFLGIPIVKQKYGVAFRNYVTWLGADTPFARATENAVKRAERLNTEKSNKLGLKKK